ncbi:MAG: lipoate--protein ligase [Bacteroidota bacterium]|nr:lipoate--protein ligase [Bacteroidota bacterium]MDP4205150.1 lipoate--protein ligase [Bacteroidota bacterium]
MILLSSETLDPFFNLAAEEYLLKNVQEELFFLYRNTPCVIVGKHQNALAEVNIAYLLQHGIPVIRRISGGGAVYHDEGNVNYSFHLNAGDTSNLNFRKFKEPVVYALKQLGLNPEFSTRNDILLSGLKISGSAEHVSHKRVISHGTLLYNANLEHLSQTLRVKEGLYAGKAVKSVKSKVSNISSFLDQMKTNEGFFEALLGAIQSFFPDSERMVLSGDEKAKIRVLAEEKYKTWEWNFGYSPDYKVSRDINVRGCGQVKIDFAVSRGVIKSLEATLMHDLTDDMKFPDFSQLNGQHHRFENIRDFFVNEKNRLSGLWDVEASALSLM